MVGFTNPAVPNLADFDTFIATNMQIPPPVLPISIAAPAKPTLTANVSGGSLPSGTVYVTVTYVSLYGETTASPGASVAVTGPTGQVVVTSPVAAPGAVAFNVYAASTAAAEALQNGSSPVPIGTPYSINALVTGTAAAPTTNTAGSPWPGWMFNQAMTRVLYVPTIASIDYVMAVYNCAGHLLLQFTPDQPGQSYFSQARTTFKLNEAISGVVASASDQGTSTALAVPDGLRNMTIDNLNFFRTPWGREYLAYAQDFSTIWGLS